MLVRSYKTKLINTTGNNRLSLNKKMLNQKIILINKSEHIESVVCKEKNSSIPK